MMKDDFSELRNAADLPTDSYPGRRWTAVTGLTVFALILASVWWFLLPRLRGEPLSTTARVEFRAATPLPEDEGADERVYLPIAGDTRQFFLLGADVLLDQTHIHSFRGTYDADENPILQLNLTPEGGRRLSEYTRVNEGSYLGIIINNELVSAPIIRTTLGDSVQVQFGRVHRELAEEIFARLTQ